MPAGAGRGQYKPLTDAQIETIYHSALRILEEIGMGEAPQVLIDQACSKGAFVNDDGRLCFPQNMVEEQIAGACKSFTYYGRNPKHDFTVGGDSVYFGTGGAAVQTLDIDSGEYRPSTLNDLYDFTRLMDTLNNVSWFTRCCVATDVPDNYDLDVNTAYALLVGTEKPVGTSFTLAEHVDPIIDMFDMALGGKASSANGPSVKPISAR